MQNNTPLEQQLEQKLTALSQKVETGNRDTLELKSRLAKIEETLDDSNREYHTIKHNVAQLQGTIPGLVKVLEKNDETLRLLRDDILSTQHERRLVSVETWAKEMQAVGTLEMWRTAMTEVRTNTEFRTKISSYWVAIGGAGILLTLATAIIHFINMIK
jgi:chromosome segregation ATPase